MPPRPTHSEETPRGESHQIQFLRVLWCGRGRDDALRRELLSRDPLSGDHRRTHARARSPSRDEDDDTYATAAPATAVPQPCFTICAFFTANHTSTTR